MEEYLEWYQNNMKLPKDLLKERFNDLVILLLKKQNHRCAITGEVLNFDRFDNCSFYLKDNKKKPWLPRLELVCWVFRKIKYPKYEIENPIRKHYNNNDLTDDEYYEDEYY